MATMAAEGHFGCEGNEMKEERGCRMQVLDASKS